MEAVLTISTEAVYLYYPLYCTTVKADPLLTADIYSDLY